MSKNRKICDIYLKINRFTIDLNLKLLHNKTIETQKRGKTAMQIKITVDIENSDILKFFELFKKDLATVAKNTTVETVEQPKNDSADFSEEKQPKKQQKKQTKNDCADFSGVQETEEKSDNTADNSTDNSTADNSLETDLKFNVATIDTKISLVRNMLLAMAKSGHKDIAKNILIKNKVPALSKLCDAEEKILVKIYNEVKNAQ